MGKYKSWADFKMAMEIQNEVSRTNLRKRHNSARAPQDVNPSENEMHQKKHTACSSRNPVLE